MTSRVHFTHPILSVETFPVQAGGAIHDFVRVRLPEWVNCVAVTRSGELVLVRQHRYGIERPTLEIPGGAVDPGEDPGEAALRELQEETGFGGGRLVPMGWVWVNPAIQDNRTWLYAALDVERVSDPTPDPTEAIAVELVPVEATARLLEAGEVSHSLAVVGLQRALLRGLLPG